jgi:hypothetical protein
MRGERVRRETEGASRLVLTPRAGVQRGPSASFATHDDIRTNDMSYSVLYACRKYSRSSLLRQSRISSVRPDHNPTFSGMPSSLHAIRVSLAGPRWQYRVNHQPTDGLVSNHGKLFEIEAAGTSLMYQLHVEGDAPWMSFIDRRMSRSSRFLHSSLMIATLVVS